jgi:hypothetical protein
MATTESAVPVDMRRAQRRFERWRSSHTGRLPIPAPLWTLAVKLARQHGVCKTAQTLRLEYGKLKRMVESAPARVRRAVPPAAFLELVPPQAAGLSECLIEVEGPRGKIRIQWKGITAPDLGGLGRALWESA